MRKLAEQSSKSAQQIAELIIKIKLETEKAVVSMDAGSKEVREGVVIVSEAGEYFRTIANNINGVVLQINVVNSSIQSITSISEGIGQSIETAAAIAEETAASTEEITASSEQQAASIQEVSLASKELTNLAGDLHDSISKFKL